MIVSTSDVARYRTHFSDGMHEAISDTTPEKGGENAGFRPHDLLEAALATCVSMAVRMYADTRSIPLLSVTTKVKMDRSRPEQVVFRYQVDFQGELTSTQKEEMLRAAAACPVRRTLSKQLRFECSPLTPSVQS